MSAREASRDLRDNPDLSGFSRILESAAHGQPLASTSANALLAPEHHLDFTMNDAGTVISYGQDARGWLAQRGAVEAVRQILACRPAHTGSTGWWCRLPPVNLRCVPLEGKGGPLTLVTVVATRLDLIEAIDLLSPAQQVVAEYAAAGATVSEIAQATDRSPETVRTHLKKVYRRLAICTRMELTWLLRRPAISFGT